MLAEKKLGRKGGGGFYKKVGAEIKVLDLKSFDYRSQEKVRFDSLGAVKNEDDVKKRVKSLVAHGDLAGTFAWHVLAHTLAYSARRLGEITDDIVNIDRAMRWGFNWDLGPFEAWDAIGVPESTARMEREGLLVPAWVKEMLASGRQTFYDGSPAAPRFYDAPKKAAAAMPADTRELSLAALKASGKVVKENLGASLIDLGDGVLGVEVHTKMNTLDPDVIAMFDAAADIAEKDFEAIVIGNDGEHFGAGANLFLILVAAQQKAWDQVEKVVSGLQGALQRLRYARVPVVARPSSTRWAEAARWRCRPTPVRRTRRRTWGWSRSAWGCSPLAAAACAWSSAGRATCPRASTRYR